MLGEIKIEPVGKGVHERPEPRRAGGVLLLQLDGVYEELHAQILVEGAFALGLRQAAHGVDVVGLDAVEVVFGLGVLHAEDRVGIGFSVDVRDAPVVADDADVPGLLFPARQFLIFRRLEGERGGCGRQYEDELLHG